MIFYELQLKLWDHGILLHVALFCQLLRTARSKYSNHAWTQSFSFFKKGLPSWSFCQIMFHCSSSVACTFKLDPVRLLFPKLGVWRSGAWADPRKIIRQAPGQFSEGIWRPCAIAGWSCVGSGLESMHQRYAKVLYSAVPSRHIFFFLMNQFFSMSFRRISASRSSSDPYGHYCFFTRYPLISWYAIHSRWTEHIGFE